MPLRDASHGFSLRDGRTEASTVFNADPDALWREMIRKTEMQVAWGERGDAEWQD